MKKLATEKKDEIIRAARLAKSIPEEKTFWKEVSKRMDIRQKNMVKPR